MFTAYLLILVLAMSNLTLQESTDGGECIRKRKTITIEWPDCEPAFTKVPTCSGTCKSFDVVISTAPYFEKQCHCCKSARHSVKKRQLQFNCQGKMENHTVFIPIIEKCSCVHCNVLWASFINLWRPISSFIMHSWYSLKTWLTVISYLYR